MSAVAVDAKLTDKVEGFLEVLLDVLVWRVARRYLFVLEAWLQLAAWLLAGDVKYAVRTDSRRIDCVSAIAKQQMRKNVRCRMRFNVV